MGILNKEDMLVLVWILNSASAKMGANDNLLILPSESYSSPSWGGIEFVTITWSKPDFLMFYKALPVNKPCVANVHTETAPFYFKTLVASQRVPAVSMISSIMITFLF